MGALRTGARVQSRRWADVHGTVSTFTEDEVAPDEVRQSSRPAPRDGGPGFVVVHRG